MRCALLTASLSARPLSPQPSPARRMAAPRALHASAVSACRIINIAPRRPRTERALCARVSRGALAWRFRSAARGRRLIAVLGCAGGSTLCNRSACMVPWAADAVKRAAMRGTLQATAASTGTAQRGRFCSGGQIAP